MVAYVASQIPVIDFTAVKSTNGYQKLPSGLILQWVGTTVPSGTTQVGLPIAFPTAYLHAFVTPGTNPAGMFGTGPGSSLQTVSVSNSYGANQNIALFAIGY
jgi:hypothetical protein